MNPTDMYLNAMTPRGFPSGRAPDVPLQPGDLVEVADFDDPMMVVALRSPERPGGGQVLQLYMVRAAECCRGVEIHMGRPVTSDHYSHLLRTYGVAVPMPPVRAVMATTMDAQAWLYALLPTVRVLRLGWLESVAHCRWSTPMNPAALADVMAAVAPQQVQVYHRGERVGMTRRWPAW